LIADQVVLQNGDRITGKVVKKDATTLTFKSDVFGTITMPWKNVESLSTDEPVYVVLPGDKTLLGTLDATREQVRIAAENGSEESSLTDLRFIRDSAQQRSYQRLLNPNWTELWAGTATFELAGTRGNADASTFAVGLNAARQTNGDKSTAYFNMLRSSATVDEISATTAQAVRGGWGYSRNVAARLTWNTFNDYEYDRFQNLDLRFVLGGGLGLTVWKYERSQLDLVGGGAYNRESFAAFEDAGPLVRNSAEVYTGDDFKFKLSSGTSLYQNARFFGNLTNTGEYRFNFDLGANTKLTRWLTWNGSISNRYLSNPIEGRQTNDLLYTTGIGVTFSR
jgi:hypothetical protein